MNFKCTECNYPEEDNRLQVVVKDGVTHRFYIYPDGSLEHYDTDGDGQEIYLECPVCGHRYNFVNEITLEKEFALKKWTQYSMNPISITLDDLVFKKQPAEKKVEK